MTDTQHRRKSPAPSRRTFLGLALATIAIGLIVHRSGGALGAVTTDVAGDALWAMMIAWWIGVAVPTARGSVRAVVAVVICIGVEFSQLVHSPAIDALRRTQLGHLVMGSDFDARDILAYVLGVMAAVALEIALQSRQHPA